MDEFEDLIPLALAVGEDLASSRESTDDTDTDDTDEKGVPLWMTGW